MAYDIEDVCEDVVDLIIDMFDDARHTRTKKEFKDSMSLCYTAMISKITIDEILSEREEMIVRKWRRRLLDEADEWYDDNIAIERDDFDDDDY